MPDDGSVHTAEGSSRKRVKISNGTPLPAGNPPKLETPEVVSLISSPAKNAALPAPKVETNGHANGAPCHHEQAFRGLNSDLDAMRQLITCKICDRFLYEPYSLTCGHTYCYSCLSSWMVDNHKKTCPDCRSIIKDQPAPSYVIREMVLIFTSKSELLPDGETSEEHVQLAKEEAEIVTKDKANMDRSRGGLFKGHFKRGSAFVPMLALRDPSDNVFRCPQCINEIEDGWCQHCHVRVTTGEGDDSDDDDFSDNSLDLDHDLNEHDHDLRLGMHDDMSDYSGYADFEHPAFHDYGVGGHIDLWSEDESDDDDEQDPDMDRFINDDTIQIDDDSEGESEGTATGRPIILSDDEEDEEAEDQPQAPRRRRLVAAFRRPRVAASPEPGTSQASNAGDTVEESEDDEEPVVSNSQRSRRGRRQVMDDSDEDEDEEPIINNSQRSQGRSRIQIMDDSDEDEESDETETTSRSVHGGFSPLEEVDGRSRESSVSGEDSVHDYGRSVSASSGRTDGSMDENDGMSDESEDEHSTLDGDGWALHAPRYESSISQADRLSGTTTNEYQGHPFSHRLHTLGPHSARHADPPPTYSRYLPPAQRLDSIIRARNALHRPQVQPYGNRNFVPPAPAYVYQAPRDPNPAAAPMHPFGLSNVLNGIQQRTVPQQAAALYARAAMGNRRTNSNVSSQSSIGGGVDVRGNESGSSGSSATVCADEGAAGRRRRRFREIEEDDEY